MTKSVTVVGAGLAGSEAAWQLAQRGIHVDLIEMRPQNRSPVHVTDGFAELVCSNSLRSDRIENAVGLLKEEMRLLDSLVMEAAESTRVPAGGALAVDRNAFSGFITDKLYSHPCVSVRREEVTQIPDGYVIIATGPLTSDAFAERIIEYCGADTLSFYDAVAPIVSAESLDMDRLFFGSRYDRGDDYLNAPMTKQEYDDFVFALLNAERAPVHEFEQSVNVFEGCMPVESMAERGHLTLAHGPLKPVGIRDPKTGTMPYAVVQLRKEDEMGSSFNLVGFQTRLKFGEQKRVFGMIPGLKDAEFLRYGVMHRNTFLKSPGILDERYALIKDDRIRIAGQISGVEGYVESAASGLLAGRYLAGELCGKETRLFSNRTAIGALANYVAKGNGSDFQPMNVNYGIIAPLDYKIRNKKERYQAVADRALKEIEGTT